MPRRQAVNGGAVQSTRPEGQTVQLPHRRLLTSEGSSGGTGKPRAWRGGRIRGRCLIFISGRAGSGADTGCRNGTTDSPRQAPIDPRSAPPPTGSGASRGRREHAWAWWVLAGRHLGSRYDGRAPRPCGRRLLPVPGRPGAADENSPPSPLSLVAERSGPTIALWGDSDEVVHLTDAERLGAELAAPLRGVVSEPFCASMLAATLAAHTKLLDSARSRCARLTC